ncbi:hypothetical protein [Mesoterricola sediminis]|uniref:Uncharacterized protein n=1 Tax=Mesoterricola sediminis TaxID=2927980 RepID=A0AA48H6G4_9BACT|nr:hypothetical protein [Mesoterricola sediminis]BDU76858.1 hypothetical protein METESE_18160 [Mesoterricola sediminis]
MNGTVKHVNPGTRAAVILLETGDCMVASLRKPGGLEAGDPVETQGLWLGDRGEITNLRTGRACAVTILSISRDEGFAEKESDDPELTA